MELPSPVTQQRRDQVDRKARRIDIRYSGQSAPVLRDAHRNTHSLQEGLIPSLFASLQAVRDEVRDRPEEDHPKKQTHTDEISASCPKQRFWSWRHFARSGLLEEWSSLLRHLSAGLSRY